MPFKLRQENGIIARGRTFSVTLLDETGSATEKMDMSGLAERCPCYGRETIAKKGQWEICPVCRREDDPVQKNVPDFAGGANARTLNEEKKRTVAKLPNKGVMGRSIIEQERYLNGIYTQLMLPELLVNRL
ncbi:hypothetical protein MML63_13840 [Kosakonia sacchari]|uniref:CPCC family cysteine-rich protein n=1 Tax=Kosakonia sacchari TaxID=1158459 RepID=UPI0025B18820|nr:CPCC family cysteine-rich protein [Kosakonia sacchari]MDN2486709.1 hypothetical protein [Kosakonia sacchari]